MAVGIDTKEKAFQFFCQGTSIDKIAEEIKVNRKTILRWKNEYGWESRREKILADVHKKSDRQQADIIANLLSQTVELREEILESLKYLQFKSKEGALSAYQQLTNLIVKFTPERADIKDEALKKIFAILFSHPKVGPVIERYKDEIITSINKELQKL